MDRWIDASELVTEVVTRLMRDNTKQAVTAGRLTNGEKNGIAAVPELFI